MLWKFATHCGKVGKKLVNTDMLKNFPSCYPGKLFRFSRLLEVGPQLEGSLWNWFHGQLLQNIKFRLNFPRISGSGHTQENSVKTSFHRTSWPERILLSNNPTPPPPQSDSASCDGRPPSQSGKCVRGCLMESQRLFASRSPLLLWPHLQTLRRKTLGRVLKPRIESLG